MYFNEIKYKKCISNLISSKAYIVISYILLFAIIGAGLGLLAMFVLNTNIWYIIATSTGIGAVTGLIIGLSSIWKVEMKIQEAYWKIDILKELQKQTSIANKNAPIAKTVVAIENKQSDDKKEDIIKN